MSDTMRQPGKLSAQERLLRIMLLSFMVPLRDGGGLVFPIGFPGAGYRLDVWQLDKFRALLDRRLLSPETKQEMRRIRVALLVMIGLVACGNAVSFYFFHDNIFGDYARQWFPVLWIAPFALLGIHSYLFNYKNYTAFKKHFDRAPRVSRSAYLHRRFLGYQVAVSFNPLNASLLALVAALSSVLLLQTVLSRVVPFFAIVGFLLLFIAVFNSCLLVIYWQFRRIHRRGPNEADLKPVHYPTAKPS